MKRPYFLFLFLLLSWVTVACDSAVDQFEAPKHQAWINQHWQRPLAPQGKKPSTPGYESVGLAPETCGACHPSQFADWQNSLHAKAVGPGLLGQYVDQTDLSEFAECMGCHAPLAEQVSKATMGLMAPGLHQKGLVCAGCHVRQWSVKGPAPLNPPQSQFKVKPHNGFEVKGEFENPLFCAACHQFPSDGYALEGKLLENTYQEWKVSSYAKKGVTCQKCHMPERRHLWRGIHDPKMVAQGLSVIWKGFEDAAELKGTLLLSNQGAGHALPTYVTPLIEVEFIQLDGHKKPLKEGYQIAQIGRMVSLDIATELFDTRILPGETTPIIYSAKPADKAKWLHIQVKVKPDEFYRRFYQASLRQTYLDKGRPLIEQAMANAKSNEYILWEKRVALPH